MESIKLIKKNKYLRYGGGCYVIGNRGTKTGSK